MAVDDVIDGFLAGTCLLVDRDGTAVEAAVESLVVGDLVYTSAGGVRPIRRIRHHRIDTRTESPESNAYPVRISANALASKRPARDLYVAPGHSVCFDMLGEVLVPADALVNSWTIQRVELDEWTYWRVEFDDYDIVFAENQPVESCTETVDSTPRRGHIGVLDDLVDVDVSLCVQAKSRRPLYREGPAVEAIRDQLRRRLPELGWTLRDDLELHLVIDGRKIDPVVRGLAARFHVPAKARHVWLVSPTARPCDILGTPDDRDLGLFIAGIRIEDGFSPYNIAIDDALLCIGFHNVEEGPRRWTAGRALLPIALWAHQEHDFFLCLNFAIRPVPRWCLPEKQ